MVILPVQSGRTLPVVQFQGARHSAGPASHAFLRLFDFHEIGKSTVPQNMLIYGLVILSRIVAALVRGYQADSFSEVREHAVRDVLGWTFWFFAAAGVQRLVVRCLPPKYRDMLVANPYEINKSATTAWGRFKERAKWEFNFLVRDRIPSAQQLDDRLAQCLRQLEELRLSPEARRLETETLTRYFNRLGKFRSLASGVGLILAIALLGVGIPLINILVTRRKNAEKRRLQNHQMAPAQVPLYTRPRLFQEFQFPQSSAATTVLSGIPPAQPLGYAVNVLG